MFFQNYFVKIFFGKYFWRKYFFGNIYGPLLLTAYSPLPNIQPLPLLPLISDFGS